MLAVLHNSDAATKGQLAVPRVVVGLHEPREGPLTESCATYMNNQALLSTPPQKTIYNVK